MKPTIEQSEAVRTMLYDLERYRGEPVVKDEHPLHLSVQALERLCQQNPRRVERGIHPQLADSEVRRAWYSLLWSSRGTHNTEWFSYRGSGVAVPDRSAPDAALAMRRAAELRDLIRPWLDDFPEEP